MNTAIET